MRERPKELVIEELFCMDYHILGAGGQASPKEEYSIRLGKVRCKFFRSRWTRSCHVLMIRIGCIGLFSVVSLARVFVSFNQSGARRHTKVFPTIPGNLYL